MTAEKFNEQVLRLTEVFGATHYTAPRLKVILTSVKHIRDDHFERTITRLIATKRTAPLVTEITEAYEAILSEDRQRSRENAPTVGMLGQLQEAARRTTADKDFVKACMKLLEDKLDGRITHDQFLQGCGLLDEAAREFR